MFIEAEAEEDVKNLNCISKGSSGSIFWRAAHVFQERFPRQAG